MNALRAVGVSAHGSAEGSPPSEGTPGFSWVYLVWLAAHSVKVTSLHRSRLADLPSTRLETRTMETTGYASLMVTTPLTSGSEAQ